MRRWLVAVTAVACVAAGLAGPADARIILDKSIDGVGPGMTSAQVRQKLGKPAEVFRNRGSFPNDVWSYGRSTRTTGHVYAVFLRHGKKLQPAAYVGTVKAMERTGNGIHVGMTLKALRARAPGLVCDYRLCFTHDPNSYAGLATRFVLYKQRKTTVVSKVEIIRMTPPKPIAPPPASGPRPAAEGGPNVARDFTVSCPCWPGDAIGFDVVSVREQPSYALVEAYQWDFGDGTSTAGWYESAASHSYDKPGTYTVTLTMVDEELSRWVLTKTIEVKAPRPASESPNPLMYRDFDVVCPEDTCSSGSLLTFNPVLAREDGVHSYPTLIGFDWGDGTSEPSYGGTYATHTYSQPGSYVATMTMADENGERWFVTKAVQVTP